MLWRIPEYNPDTEEVWEVWVHELWGNRKDGFDFNNRHSQGALLAPKNADADTLLHCLREQGFISTRYTASAVLEYADEDCWLIQENRRGNEYYGETVGSMERQDD